MVDFFSIIVAAALVNNIILSQLLGVSSLFYTSDKPEQRILSAAEPALLTSLLMLPIAMINWFMFQFILVPLQLEFFGLTAFLLCSAVISILALMLFEHLFPLSARKQRLELFLIAGNSAIIGLSLQITQKIESFVIALATSIGAALGFLFVVIIFAALRQRLETSDVPLAFRGAPIDVLCAGLVAMALQGFSGLV